MTKDEKERREEIATFSRRQALKWSRTREQLKAVLAEMDEHNQFGAEYHELDQLISAVDARATAYWNDFYKNK